jgi:drug/metabolite transporter (DMT)-like permease
MATVAALSTAFFIIADETIPGIMSLIVIAFVNSAAFLAGTVTHIEALKNVPATIAYPLIRLNVVLVILFSVIYFDDRLSGYQVIGIILALLVMVVLAADANDQKPSYTKPKRGFVLIGVALLCGALASISSKFAALHTSKLATVFSLGLKAQWQKGGAGTNRRDAIGIGLLMGVTNFVGFYAFLAALSHGPLSLIAPITGMHFVIAIVFSVLIYRERLTPARIGGVALTIVSIVLLRL